MTSFDTPTVALSADRLSKAGLLIARYGLVVILLLIGGLKYTAAEAMGIQPLIAHSPLMSWLYAFLSVRDASRAIGTLEILAALLIACRVFSAPLSAAGSFMATATFFFTLSFLFSTPGVWDPAFPALSATGSFLIKDIVLFGASLLTAGEALSASRDLARATR